MGPCSSAADCDDGVECTRDVCDFGVCVSTPDNTLCTGDGQVCSPILRRCADTDECVPEQCVMDRRLPGTCQVGVCTEGDCALGPVNSACGAGEFCCGNGLCAFCDDGSPCTTDSCDLTAAGCDPESPTDACCSHVPFDGDCDDGSFCNGPETCVAGACVGGEQPCEAGATCMETIDRCDSCVTDAGCPDAPGPWSPCAQNGGAFCNNTGTRTRTVETSRCEEGACVAAAPRSETDASCAFDPTTLGPCMAPTTPMFGACTFGATPCAGTQSRTVTTFACAADGACRGTDSTESRGCNAAAMTTCGTTLTPAFGPCGGFADACTRAGTQSRTLTTFACNGTGGCISTTMPDSRACMRDNRDGMMCGSPITGRPCLADGVDSCTGTQVIGRMCAGGTCGADRTTACNMSNTTMCGEDRSDISCAPDGTTSCTMGTEVMTPVRRRCDGSGSCEDRRQTPITTSTSCTLTATEANGAMCDDGDRCTINDVCTDNTCGGDPKCEGMCLDMGTTSCTDEESCQCNGGSGMCSCG